MGYYKFRKKDLIKELEQVPDDDFIMINMGDIQNPVIHLHILKTQQVVDFGN